MADRICIFCGTRIANGDFCCPQCGAVPPSEGRNTADARSERLEKNKKMNAAAAVSTAVVVALTAAILLPKLSKLDLPEMFEGDSTSTDTESDTTWGLPDYDADSMVREGMQSWEDEYGSLFRQDFSVPEFNFDDFVNEDFLFPSYENVESTYDPETGTISNKYFSLTADSNYWSLEGENVSKALTVSCEGTTLSVRCRRNAGTTADIVSAEGAASRMAETISQDEVLVDDPYEYKAGSFTGYAVFSSDMNTDKLRIFVTSGEVMLQFEVSCDAEDHSYSDSRVEELLNSLEMNNDSSTPLDNYSEEYFTDKGGGVYESNNVSFKVGSAWTEESSSESWRSFKQEGVKIGLGAMCLSSPDKTLRVTAEEAADIYSDMMKGTIGRFEKGSEDIGGKQASTLTGSFSDGINENQLKYIFLTSEDSLVIITVSGTTEQLGAVSDGVNSVLSSVTFIPEEDKPKGTIEGVNLFNYSVPASYDGDYRVRCEFASLWVDPEKWTITGEALDTGNMSFGYDDGDASFFIIFAQSSLIEKYTPYDLADYYSKNLGKRVDYELVTLDSGKSGKYTSGDLHMKRYKEDTVELYMRIVKDGDKAVMFYWMVPEGGYKQAEKSVEQMLGTFEFDGA